jgi:hypothetical protein
MARTRTAAAAAVFFRRVESHFLRNLRNVRVAHVRFCNNEYALSSDEKYLGHREHGLEIGVLLALSSHCRGRLSDGAI